MWEDKGQVWQAMLCPKNGAKTELTLPTYTMGLQPPAKESGVTVKEHTGDTFGFTVSLVGLR